MGRGTNNFSMTGRLGLLGLLAVFLTGCGSSRPVFVTPDLPNEFPNHERSYIVQAVEDAARPFMAIETKSRLRLETESERRSVNLQIKYRRADTLQVNAKVILGIEAMKSLITPDSFYVYDRLHRRLYHGSVDQAYRLLPTPGPLDEMFESIVGVLEIDQSTDWQVSHDSSYYYLSTVDSTTNLKVDPRLWRVVRLEARTATGDLIERRSFTDFDSFGGFIVPRRIEINRPRAGERFQVYHRSVLVNPEPLSFRFEVGRIDENILVKAED